MSEATILQSPANRAPANPIPAAAPAATQAIPKLVRSRDEAVAFLQTQIARGNEIKSLRIRSGQDLDQARAAKLEWTMRNSEILSNLFDQPAVAEECNDWVGRIYPEYAEFGNFVEQFHAEMDHRIARLRGVLKRIERAGDIPRPTTTDCAAKTGSDPVLAARDDASAVEPSTLRKVKGLLVCREADDATHKSVVEFLRMLDVEVLVGPGATEIAGLLDSQPDPHFALVLSSGRHQEQDFDLGFCAGRLGLKRVILLMPSSTDATTSEPDSRGLTKIELDSTGGWQLHLARALRHSGIDLDLNKLC